MKPQNLFLALSVLTTAACGKATGYTKVSKYQGASASTLNAGNPVLKDLKPATSVVTRTVGNRDVKTTRKCLSLINLKAAMEAHADEAVVVSTYDLDVDVSKSPNAYFEKFKSADDTLTKAARASLFLSKEAGNAPSTSPIFKIGYASDVVTKDGVTGVSNLFTDIKTQTDCTSITLDDGKAAIPIQVFGDQIAFIDNNNVGRVYSVNKDSIVLTTYTLSSPNASVCGQSNFTVKQSTLISFGAGINKLSTTPRFLTFVRDHSKAGKALNSTIDKMNNKATQAQVSAPIWSLALGALSKSEQDPACPSPTSTTNTPNPSNIPSTTKL